MVNRPPGANEFEVSLFGPGYGESVVLHVPGEGWLIVDSCLDEREPAALRYLRRLAVPPTDVRLVVATHWHDDHVRGLADVVAACPGARVAFPENLGREQLFELLELAASDRSSVVGSGVTEFAKLVSHLGSRPKDPRQLGVPQFCSADRALLQSPAVEVWCLSPSDKAKLLLIGQLVAAGAQIASRRRVTVPRPNHAAAVILVKTPTAAVLLGSDLEEQGSPALGWSAIVTSQGRPQFTASVFKVAHHGSATGECAAVWAQLLNNPVAILTPFVNGNVSLPTGTDLQRIRSRAGRTLLTSAGRLKAARFKDAVLRRMVPTVARKIQSAVPLCGHVRLRSSTQSPSWTVEKFNGAVEVT